MTNRTSTYSLILLIAGYLLPTSLQAGPAPVITESEIRAHVEFLAAPELEGRSATEQGAKIAQRYIASRFLEYGLDELSSAPGYYQPVPLTISKTDYQNSSITITAPGLSRKLIANKDFYFFPRGGKNTTITASVLLCGYGIDAPEFDYNDYTGVDPKGRVILMFSGEPKTPEGQPLFTGGKPSKYSRDVVKARIAKEKGAAAVFILPDTDHPDALQNIIGRYLKNMNEPIVQLTEAMEDFPVFYLSPSTVRPLINEYINLKEHQQQIHLQGKGNPKPIRDIKITLSIAFKERVDIETANIVGYLPGEIPEAVLVMAHHDHEGIKDGELYPGADDNASGVAGLLGIARLFKDQKKNPLRSVIFLSTGAEEEGSLGARYFISHPPYPLDDIVTVINMDEIGRNGSSQFRAMMDPTIPGEQDLLMVFYSGQTPALARITEENNAKLDLNLMLEPVLQFHSSSDHVPFHQAGIPSLFLFTGFHSDYTSPRDTVDKIVFEKLTRVTQLAFRLAWDLAQQKNRPLFDRSITEVERTGTYGN